MNSTICLEDRKDMASKKMLSMSNKNEIIVLKTQESIEAIRDTWEQMQNNESQPTPDADIDRYLSVIEAYGNDVQPFIILVKNNDYPQAMLIGRIGKQKLKLKVGYRTLFSPTLRCLTVAYGGILGRPEGHICTDMIRELQTQLRQGEVDVIYFNRLRTDDYFYKDIQKTSDFLTRGYMPKNENHWRMSFPENIDQFYANRSKKSRYNLRRNIKKFEQDYPGKRTFTEYITESDLNEFIENAADISLKTYQHALGAGIVNDEKTRCVLKAAAKNGWFHGCILFAADKPCAFQLGLCYRNTYYLVKIGYDPTFNSYSPGTILFLKTLESLCENSSIDMDELDFYFGDADYKSRFGTESWPEATVHIFAPRFYPIFINMLHSSMMGTNAFLHGILNRIGSVGWIKRRWRNSVQADN